VCIIDGEEAKAYHHGADYLLSLNGRGSGSESGGAEHDDRSHYLVFLNNSIPVRRDWLLHLITPILSLPSSSSAANTPPILHPKTFEALPKPTPR